MMARLTTTLGARGTLTLPKRIRDEFGLTEGSLIIVETSGDSIRLRPAVAVPRDTETYTPERRAEFLLNACATPADYTWARAEVERMGLNPDSIDHVPPES